MTQKQMEKEAKRQAFIFEEACQDEEQATKRVKFKDLAEEWFELVETTQEMKISTIQRYKTCSERTYKVFGNMYVDRITFRDVQMFILGLSHKGVNQRTGEGLSQKSQKHHLTFISDVMRYAIKCGIIKVNPCDNVSTVKTEMREKDIYSLDEMRLILQKDQQAGPNRVQGVLLFGCVLWFAKRRNSWYRVQRHRSRKRNLIDSSYVQLPWSQHRRIHVNAQDTEKCKDACAAKGDSQADPGSQGRTARDADELRRPMA